MNDALRDRNWTIAKSGSDVVIKCDSGDDALAVFNWLTEFAALQDSDPPAGSSTITLISAMRALATEIESEDRVANAAIAEAANRLERMRDALVNIWIWVESDSKSGETRQKAMHDIAEACRKALED